MYLPTLQKELLQAPSALMTEAGSSSERTAHLCRNTSLQWHIPEDKSTNIFKIPFTSFVVDLLLFTSFSNLT